MCICIWYSHSVKLIKEKNAIINASNLYLNQLTPLTKNLDTNKISFLTKDRATE